jgi:hypothetical protein
MNRLSLALAAAFAAGTLAAIPDAVTGCAAVPRHEQNVYTTDEGALIVWDEKTKTEHFVRRANFRSTGYDFGFLVPTPTQPDLDVADDHLFNELATITQARVEYQEVVEERPVQFMPGCGLLLEKRAEFGAADKSEALPRAGGVDVLEQKRLDDYDVAVLKFRKGDGDTPKSGADQVALWLVNHGYEAPPAIEKWLEKYVKDEWCITAFKIAMPAPKKDGNGPNAHPPAQRNDLRAKPIRMSFKVEKPFYPYREPENEQNRQTGEPRLLRVFFASAARYEGKLGGDKPWAGQTVWAGPAEAPRWAGLFRQAKLNEPPVKDGKPVFEAPKAEGLWLTEFEDKSSPRPGTDEVYFSPSANASPVERPVVIVTKTKIVTYTPWWHVAVLLGLPLALLLGGLAMWRVFARK